MAPESTLVSNQPLAPEASQVPQGIKAEMETTPRMVSKDCPVQQENQGSVDLKEKEAPPVEMETPDPQENEGSEGLQDIRRRSLTRIFEISALESSEMR